MILLLQFDLWTNIFSSRWNNKKVTSTWRHGSWCSTLWWKHDGRWENWIVKESGYAVRKPSQVTLNL